jgi:hypothetical protein
MFTLNDHPDISSFFGQTMNRATKRCIDRLPDGTYSLFTFEKVTDEIYGFVAGGVSQAKAQAWLCDRPEHDGEPLRLDPEGCGCTDCLTGRSVPWEMASDEQRLACAQGLLSNATGLTLTLQTTVLASY